MGIFRCIILMCLVHSNFGWIRFRYPMSRRNYLQQTAMEMLQNCGGNTEELCGVCGEGPNELPTELISTKDFQLVNTSEGPLEIRLGFRMNMQGYFELRLCKLGPDSLVNADYCRNVAPLKLFDDYRYIPGNEQNSARLQITLPPETACERCVLQVKYVPGAGSRVADQLFFDCALLRIPRGRENLKLSGRILISTDKPLSTSPFSLPFSKASTVVDLSTSPELPVTTTSATARFSDLPTTSVSVGTISKVAGMITRATPSKTILKTTGFPTNTFPSRGQSPVYLNKPLPTLSNSGKFITIITKPISSTSSANLNRRFGTIRNSVDFQNVLNSNTRTSDTLNLPNRPVVGLEQLGPETSDPFFTPRTSAFPFTTGPTDIDINQTIIINETSTNTRGTLIISVNNVTVGFTNSSDVFGINQTDFISIENDTQIISANLSGAISIDSAFDDTFLFNQTETNITQTEIPLPGETSTYQSNENQTMNQNVTDIPSRTVIGNYDTYDYNNTYTDYYYDYFTYSDIPINNNQSTNQTYIDNTNNTDINVNENMTYMEIINGTVSTDLFTNDTFMNITTLATQTEVAQADILNVTRLDTAVNSTETTDPYIFYYDYEIVTNDSAVIDNFTIAVTNINDTTSAINDAFTMDTNTTTVIPIFDTEIPLPGSTNTSINDILQTTNLPPVINVTIAEIPLNMSGTTDGQLNATSHNITTLEPNQKIVEVSDSLFDRVLFPTPKPNQRVVEVPNVITIFPTRDSVFPDTTTPSQTTISSTSRSQQNTKVTDVITERETRPITETILETITTSVASQTIPVVNITEIHDVNQTEIVFDPFIVTTTEIVPSSTDLPYTQPTPEAVSTMDPTLDITSTQTDIISNITSDVTFSADNIQQTTSDMQTIIDTTNFDITSAFGSEQMINTTYKTFISTPAPESTTLKGDYLKIITDTGSNIPKERSYTTPMISGITEKNLGIDLILDKQTNPGNIGQIADNVKTAVNLVTKPRTTPSSTFGQFQGGITYMPEVDGQTDTRGGIPIQPGMFIDIFIPKFNSDSKDNIFLEKINTSNILTTILPSNNKKNVMTGMSRDRNLSVFSKKQVRLRPDITPTSKSDQRGTSFGQFSGITLPTSTSAQADMTRRRFNSDNGMADQIPSSNRESNFMPVQKIDNILIDRSLNNENIGITSNTINIPNRVLPSTTSKATRSLRKGESRDLFFNLLESPEIMPPIFVPKRSVKREKDTSVQHNFDDNKRVMSSNTVWKGPGVGQGFGLFSGPITIQGLERNVDSLRKTNNFIGGTGPVYIPVNEVSIPLNDRRLSEKKKSKNINPAENPPNNGINTTFSTLWDLNRQNRNESKESGTFTMDTSQDQIMPPYIGIPLVWSQSDSPIGAIERTTNPNEKNWNDLPVPDIMPPIKVRLLNMTSKGTFVDNNSMLNQTDDVNKRILQKLEAIVGELQRNRAILTQSLEVNPAYEEGFQLSFDRFPGQFSRLKESPINQFGVQGSNIPKTNLLSETVQEPVLIQRIGSGRNQAEKSSSNMKTFTNYVNDPRQNGPVSDANIGSVLGPHSFNLMNMLGISDMRPLKEEEAGIRIRINSSTIDKDSLPTDKSSNINQTVIDTSFIGNSTFTMLSNTLKTFLSNHSVDNVTLLDEITPNDPMLIMDNNPTKETSLFDFNTTESTTGSIKTTEPTIVNVSRMSKMLKALSSESNSLPKVTSNNQLVISPTVSELLNPFLGTNISLDNRTESIADNIKELSETTEMKNETDNANSTTVSAITNSGQTVVSGLETVAMINELNQRKGNQRNMTDRERVRDKFVRLTFNNRVQGIKLHPSKRILIEGKYYVGKMQENVLGELEPVRVDSDVILHEVNPSKNSKMNKQQSDLHLVRLSEFNVSPSLNERVETIGNEIGSSSASKSQIVQIEPLPMKSDVERSMFATNQITGLTKDDTKSLSNQEKTTPIVTKQFFDGSDILMARAKSTNSDDIRLNMFRNINQQANSIYATSGRSISSATQKEQNIINNGASEYNLNPNEIDLFSGKFRRRLPNSLSLNPVAPSNMCTEGQLFVCKAVGDYSMVPGMRWWCFSHCRLGNCPDKKCECTCESDQTYTIRRKADTTKKLQNEIPNVQADEFSNGQNMFREKTIINLTLNGSETSKVALPIETRVKQADVGNKMGKLVITKYGKSDSINPIGESKNGPNRNVASVLSQTLGLSPSASIDVIPSPDSMEIGRINSTPVNVLPVGDSLNCKGINAFAGKPEIDRWCTINCNRNVCPQELCAC